MLISMKNTVLAILAVLVLGLMTVLFTLPIKAHTALLFKLPPAVGATSTPATLIRFAALPALGTPKFKK